MKCLSLYNSIKELKLCMKEREREIERENSKML